MTHTSTPTDFVPNGQSLRLENARTCLVPVIITRKWKKPGPGARFGVHYYDVQYSDGTTRTGVHPDYVLPYPPAVAS